MKGTFYQRLAFGLLGLFINLMVFPSQLHAQDFHFIGHSSNAATLTVGCQYTFSVDEAAIRNYYNINGDIVYNWYYGTSSITLNSGGTSGTRVYPYFGNIGTIGDNYIAITANSAPLNSNDTNLMVQYTVYDDFQTEVARNQISIQLSAINTPVSGHVVAPTSICANTDFMLGYASSQGVTQVDWYSSVNSGANANWQFVGSSTNESDQFSIIAPGIATTQYYKAVVPSCDGTANFTEQIFTISVVPSSDGGHTYGAAQVGIANNEGIISLTDYFGVIQKWQKSVDNGVNWENINETSETLNYEGLTATTIFRAQVQQCGSLVYSTTCTITVQTLNWVDRNGFDVDGGPVSVAASRTYFDDQGKTLQSQNVNITENVIMASQPLYGKYDQLVGSTLSAPITRSADAFAYAPSFITPVSAPTTAYDYTRFDEPATTRNAPEAVASTTANSLGWYYSANNTLEPYVATTAYPYTRTDAEPDGSTGVSRSTLPGDVFRLGQGKENISGKFGIQTELDLYLGLRSKYFTTAELGANATTLQDAGAQQVSMDANGQKSIAVVDKEGNTVMTMRPGETGAAHTWLTVNNTVTIGWPYSVTIPASSYAASCLVYAPSDIMVYDNNGFWVYTGSGVAFSYTSSTAGFTFYCNDPFQVLKKQLVGSVFTSTLLPSVYNQASDFYNFYTLASGPVTITPLLNAAGATDYDLLNSATGTLVSQASLANLPAGFYQVRIKKGKLTLAWSNSFQDISFNFYNQKGLLMGSIAPNGTKPIIDDYNAAANAYTRTTIPFFTSYEYDQQGRLLALNDPDAGRTEYIYRADGKLRFSQNAKQRVSDDNVFSYVGYDVLGRVIESGECVPDAYWYFRDNARMPANLEATGGNGFPDSYSCNEVVRTTYDVPVALPSLAGTYTQQFLPGRVSMTAKYLQWSVSGTKRLLCSTWFSYDDQGRTKWQIQQTATQPARTVDYTYSFMGNVTTVAYQKNVSTERLTHYYEYNDDRKLMRVYTGQDDPAAPVYSQHVEQAYYFYYLHGPLKRIIYGHDLQGVDYTYTAQGWLKSINDGDLARDPGSDGVTNTYLPDLFGTTLNYYSNDYASRLMPSTNFTAASYPARYDGTVRGNMWQTPGSPLHAYGYSYDKKGQLAVSMYGRLATSPTHQYTFSPLYAASGSPFFEGDLTYDPNGNMGHLARTDATGASAMNVSYEYLPTTNKLSAVKSGTMPVISYAYDELGQMTTQQEAAPGKSQYLEYNASGKVSAIYKDASHQQVSAVYSYDEFGRRLQQTVYLPSSYTTTSFVRDMAGNELATYVYNSVTGQTQLYEQPIYGASRLGTYRRERNNEPAEQLYELNDQLGNTRVVFRRPQTKTAVLSMEQPRWDEEKQPLDEKQREQYDNVLSHDYARKENPYGYGTELSMHLGPAKTIRSTGPIQRLVVQRGDHVHMEAWAGYPDNGGGIKGRIVPILIGAAASAGNGAFAAPATDGKRNNAALPAWKQLLGHLSLGIAIPLTGKIAGKGTGSLDPPKAALQYVLLRQSDGSFLRNGTMLVSANAEGAWEELDLDVDITETEPCILEVSVQNYDDQLDIYFDDLKVDYTEGPVVQENHFYAYGQRILGGTGDFMSWERKDRRKYRHGYQGLYATADEESGYDGFELRLYDSRIGRWLSKDPKNQYFSPYLGMGNNPISFMDPDGGGTNDWFKDNLGGFRHLSSVSNQSDVDRINPGGTYIGKTASGFLEDGSWFDGFADGSGRFTLPEISVTALRGSWFDPSPYYAFSDAGQRAVFGIGSLAATAGVASLGIEAYASFKTGRAVLSFGSQYWANGTVGEVDFADILFDAGLEGHAAGVAGGFVDFKPFRSSGPRLQVVGFNKDPRTAITEAALDVLTDKVIGSKYAGKFASKVGQNIMELEVGTVKEHVSNKVGDYYDSHR